MKHTTFENELQEIRRRAINELRKAVYACGLKYEWTYKTSPLLSNKERYMGIYTTTDENMRMLGLRCELFLRPFNDDEDNVYIENLPIEDILVITREIPETDDVKDVSGVYPVPVTWVDCDDIEMQGFNTDGMTQKDLEKLAERMCDIFNYGDFCSDLDLACKDCGLKEKED